MLCLLWKIAEKRDSLGGQRNWTALRESQSVGRLNDGDGFGLVWTTPNRSELQARAPHAYLTLLKTTVSSCNEYTSCDWPLSLRYVPKQAGKELWPHYMPSLCQPQTSFFLPRYPLLANLLFSNLLHISTARPLLLNTYALLVTRHYDSRARFGKHIVGLSQYLLNLQFYSIFSRLSLRDITEPANL